MVLSNFQCRGVLIVGQSPTVLAGGVGVVVWTFFFVYHFFSFFLSVFLSERYSRTSMARIPMARL